MVDLIWSDIGIVSNCLIQRVVSCNQKISSNVRTVKCVREEQLPSAFRRYHGIFLVMMQELCTSVTNLLRCCKTRFSSGKTGFLYYTGKCSLLRSLPKSSAKSFEDGPSILLWFATNEGMKKNITREIWMRGNVKELYPLKKNEFFPLSLLLFVIILLPFSSLLFFPVRIFTLLHKEDYFLVIN